MANEFVTRTGLIVSGSTFLPAVTTASKGYILSFDDTTKQVYYMSTSSVTVTVPGSDTQIIYNNGGAFGAASNFVFSGSNVGIGTSSPGEKLQVVGNVYVVSGLVYGASSYSDSAVNKGMSFSGTNLLLNNSGERMRIDSSGNVGIGTSSPSQKLEVSGSGYIIKASATGSDSSYFQAVNGSYDYIAGIATSLGYGLMGMNSNHALAIMTSGSERMRIAAGGNVGIGTTNPTAKFVVSDGGAAGIELQPEQTTDTNRILNYDRATATYMNLRIDANTHQFMIAGSERMRLDSAGNLGIGTTSPSEILDVQKAGTVAVRVYNTSSTADAYFNAKNSTGDAFFGINATGQYLYTSNNIPTLFYNSGSERMRITNAGNVGIGTTNPAAVLHSVGTGIVNIVQSSNTVSYTQYYNSSTGTASTNDGMTVGINGDSGYVYLRETGSLILGTADTARMTILSGGNIGIGEADPQFKLVVTDTNNYQGILVNGNNAPVIAFDRGTGQTAEWKVGISGNDGSSFSVSSGTANTDRFFINSSGNVGIGTTSPSQKLDVQGNIIIPQNNYLYFDNTAHYIRRGSSQVEIQGFNGINLMSSGSTRLSIAEDGHMILKSTTPGGGTQGDFYIIENGGLVIDSSEGATQRYIEFTTGGTQKMLITAAGNVGIGVSPSYKLDVNGQSRIAGQLILSGVGTSEVYTADASGLYLTAGTAAGMYLQSDGTFYFRKASNPYTEYMRIAGTGDVQIGTTAYAGIGGSGYLMVKNVIGLVPDNTASTNNRNWAIQANGQFSGSLDFVTSAASASFPNDAYRVSFTRTGGVVASSFTGSFSGSVSAPGSTTQIVYNSGGALAADSGLVYSGSRVGIGISSPSYKLDVDGDIRSGGSDPLVILQPNSGTYAFLQKLNASNGDFLRLYDGTDYSMFWKNTNVGIGTSNPSAKLQIVSSGLGDGGGIRITNSGAGGDDYRIWPTATVNGEGAGKLIFSNNGGNVLTLTSGGNVGINTTSPSAKLDVYRGLQTDTITRANAAAYIWGADIGLAIGQYASGPYGTWLQSLKYDNNNSFPLSLNPSGGNVGIGTSNPTTILHLDSSAGPQIRLQRSSASSNRFDMGTDGTNMEFNVRDTGAFTFGGGNVGIGTTSPGAKLDVYGVASSDTVPGLRVLGNDWGSISNAMVRFDGGPASDGNILLLKSQNNNRSDSEIFEIQNSGSNTVFVVKGTGNVGIGTSNPSYNLHVSSSGYYGGNLTVEGTITAQKLNVQQITSSVVYSSGSNIFGNSLANTQTFTGSIYQSGSEAVFLGRLDVGNGIDWPSGTNNAVATFKQSNSQGGLIIQEPGAGADRSLRLTSNGSEQQIEATYRDTGPYGNLAFKTGGSTRMYISSSGNIGIGTESPGYKLHVDANTDSLIRVSNGTETYIQSTYFGYDAGYDVIQIGDTYGKGSTGVSVALGIDPKIIAGGSFFGNEIALPEITEFITANGPSGSATDWNQNVLVISGSSIGIGTGAPSYKLDVNGTGRFASGLDVDSYILTRTKLQISNGRLFELIGTSDALNIYDGSAGASRIYISGSGNVGIGTTSPSFKLNVIGGNGNQLGLDNAGERFTQLSFLENGSQNSAIWLDGTDNMFDIYTNTSHGIRLKTGGDNTRLIVTSDGNVGIGTTSPTAGKLVVNGNISISGNNYLDFNDGDSRIVNTSGQLSFQTYTVGDFGTRMTILGNGNVGIGTSSPISGQGTPLTLASSTGYVGLTLSGSGAYSHLWQLYASGDGGSNKFFGIYDSTNATYRLVTTSGGNVGIGTTSPGGILTISGSSNQLVIGNSWSGNHDIVFAGGSSDNTGGNGNTAARIRSTAAAPGGAAVGDLRFTVNSGDSLTDAIYISGSGNVGIGTTSPTYKLNVVTNAVAGRQNLAAIDRTSRNLVTFTNPQYSANASMGLMLRVFPQSDARQGAGIIASGGSNNGVTDLSLWTSYSSDGLASTSSADLTINGFTKYIGIGTTSPTDKLSVSGGGISINNSSDPYIRFRQDGNIVSDIFTDTSGNNLVVRGSSGVGVEILANGASEGAAHLVVSGSNGNVGIGTTTPGAKLDVRGTSYFRGSALGVTIDPSATGANMYFYEGGNPVIYLQSSGSTIFNNGFNVGIGTTSPDYKLHVASSTNANIAISAATGYQTALELKGADQWYRLISQPSANGNRFDIYNQTLGAFAFSIASNLDAYLYGNVGIGTTTPDTKLHIVNDSATTNAGVKVLTLTQSTSGTPASGLGPGITFVSERPSGNVLLERAAIYGIAGADANDDGDLAFYTRTDTGAIGVSEKMRITSDGNVGIGTTSPVFPLQVSGRAQFGDTTSMASFTNAPVGIRTTNTESITLTHTAVQSWSMGVTSAGTFALRDIDTPTDRLVVTQAGNVGIGTTSPSTKLFVSSSHVSGQGMSTFKGSDYAIVNLVAPATGDGSIGYWGFRVQDPNFNDLMWFGHVTSSTQSGFTVAPNFNTTNSASLYVARSNGNVGIGTTSPSGKLEVIGANTSFRNDVNGGTNTVYIRNWGSSANAALVFGTLNGDDSSTILTHTSANTFDITNYGDPGSAIRFGTRNAGGISDIRMKIDQDGNVGIGVTNPVQKLEVAGVISAYDRNNGSTNGQLWASTTAGATTVVLHSSGSSYLNGGSVGIGTTSPAYKLHVSGAVAIENQGTTTIESTTFAGTVSSNTNIAFVPTGSFKAAFFDYYVASGSVNMRAGTVMAVHNNSTSRYTDTSTADIGTTAPVDFSTSIVAGSLVLTANIASGTWEIKTAYRAL